MVSPLDPTIPSAQAWLNDAWVHAQALQLLRRAVDCLGERGFKVYAGPMAPVVRKSTIGRSLRMAYLVKCGDALTTLSLRWDLGAFVSNIGAGRGELALHLGNLCVTDGTTDGASDLGIEGENLIALLSLWNLSGISFSQRTDNLLEDLRRRYEAGLVELNNGTFEEDLPHFVDTVDEAFRA